MPTNQFATRPATSDIVKLRVLATHDQASRRTIGLTVTRQMRARLGWEEGDQLLLQVTKSGRLLAQKIDLPDTKKGTHHA